MRLIDVDRLVEQFNNKGIHIEIDLPVEEILGEDVDLDDFAMLMQDGVMAYKKMVLDTIKNQPTAYSIEKVVKELKKRIVIEPLDCADAEWNNALYKAIEIVKGSVKNE